MDLADICDMVIGRHAGVVTGYSDSEIHIDRVSGDTGVEG